MRKRLCKAVGVVYVSVPAWHDHIYAISGWLTAQQQATVFGLLEAVLSHRVRYGYAKTVRFTVGETEEVT